MIRSKLANSQIKRTKLTPKIPRIKTIQKMIKKIPNLHRSLKKIKTQTGKIKITNLFKNCRLKIRIISQSKSLIFETKTINLCKNLTPRKKLMRKITKEAKKMEKM